MIGLQPATLQFLIGLKKNNHKAWMDENRNAYDAARSDVLALGESVLLQLGQHDPEIAHLSVRDCLFRINRDIRFSKNKAPYKTNMAMFMSKGGKKAQDAAGYYLHIEPGQAFLGGGIWMPPAPVLKSIRQEIDYNLDAFTAILADPSFSSHYHGLSTEGDVRLTRPPKGYEADNPALPFLLFKSFIVSTQLSDKSLTAHSASAEIAEKFSAMTPFIHFLNEAAGASA